MVDPHKRVSLTVALAALSLIGITACRATVAGDPDRPIKIEAHITLDVRQIKEEARSIEDIVSGKAPVPAEKPRSQGIADWIVPTAWADPQGMEQALASRRARFEKLKALKAQGLVGEDREGHVVGLGAGPEVQQLLEAENRDRETIYRAQAAQKGAGEEALPTIRAAFAQEQRERASSGEKIQQPSGEWVTK